MRQIKGRIVGVILSCMMFIGLPCLIYANSWIDVTDVSKGVVHVQYTSTSNKRLKVMIQLGDKKYTYNLNNTGQTESFPLQLGNGSYKISLMENTTDSKYRLVGSQNITLQLSDSNVVYLNAVQSMDWNANMQAIQYGDKLKSQNTGSSVTQLFYENTVANYSYDYNKLATLPTTYLPVIDSTFASKTGICYDFSSLYASMLRSQGVPVKLVKGYTPNAVGYHAWNEAYDEKTGKWVIIDTTYDLQVRKKNITTKMAKSSSDYEKVNEY